MVGQAASSTRVGLSASGSERTNLFVIAHPGKADCVFLRRPTYPTENQLSTQFDKTASVSAAMNNTSAGQLAHSQRVPAEPLEECEEAPVSRQGRDDSGFRLFRNVVVNAKWCSDRLRKHDLSLWPCYLARVGYIRLGDRASGDTYVIGHARTPCRSSVEREIRFLCVAWPVCRFQPSGFFFFFFLYIVGKCSETSGTPEVPQQWINVQLACIGWSSATSCSL